jgi:hypothetical protein
MKSLISLENLCIFCKEKPDFLTRFNRNLHLRHLGEKVVIFLSIQSLKTAFMSVAVQTGKQCDTNGTEN